MSVDDLATPVPRRVKLKASIIICTCDRARQLQQTLTAIADVQTPEAIPTELIIVDNASTDTTAEVIKQFRSPNMAVRYLYEPRRGQCYARNAGIAAAQGEIILFTDDDVRPPPHWVEGMCTPILSGAGHAVAGGIQIAPHLHRPWMQTVHRRWLASTEEMQADDPQQMTGANMAFTRDVLSRVPGFDVELGPGALGFADETLFSWQLKLAGFRIVSALDTTVEHHFDIDRLLRKSFLSTAGKFGRTMAYLSHHWHHNEFSFPRFRAAKHQLQLAHLRVTHRAECSQHEGASLREMALIEEIAFHQQCVVERKRPRNYAKDGRRRSSGCS